MSGGHWPKTCIENDALGIKFRRRKVSPIRTSLYGEVGIFDAPNVGKKHWPPWRFLVEKLGVYMRFNQRATLPTVERFSDVRALSHLKRKWAYVGKKRVSSANPNCQLQVAHKISSLAVLLFLLVLPFMCIFSACLAI